MLNPRNIKLLNADEIEYLLQKHNFIIEDGKIKIEFKNTPARSQYWDVDSKKSAVYFIKFHTKRTAFKITPEAKKLFVEKDGKWNLIFIQQVLFYLYKHNIDFKTLSDSELEKYYKECELSHIALKGTSIN